MIRATLFGGPCDGKVYELDIAPPEIKMPKRRSGIYCGRNENEPLPVIENISYRYLANWMDDYIYIFTK